MNQVLKIFYEFLEKYGPQGWWPINNKYHKNTFNMPNKEEQFEIIIGAILTQNTAWTNVEKALNNLREIKSLSLKRILNQDINKIKEAIRPAGYFNQKANYLRKIAEFYKQLNGSVPTRKEILAVKGVGQETADSILLYAYNQPEFVVDAYTKRIFTKLGLIKENASYHEIKEFFENQLKKDYKIFNEYHALIVEHAKNQKRK